MNQQTAGQYFRQRLVFPASGPAFLKMPPSFHWTTWMEGCAVSGVDPSPRPSKFQPMRPCLLLLFIVFVGSLQAQQHLALYPATPPDSKPITGLRDSSVFYLHGKDSMEWVMQVASPELIMYLPEKKNRQGAAVIICPGGGYAGLSMANEGHQIARRLQAAGVAAFVLKYRLPNPYLVDNKEVVPLQDAQRAIQLVRENAGKWNIQPRKIGILGSSAGGHLASTAGTHWQKAQIPNARNTSLRPDFLVLNYPVISFADSLTHYGSRFNLIGPVLAQAEIERIMQQGDESDAVYQTIQIDPEMKKLYSNELQVRANTPPTFITTAVDDEVVKVQNTLVFIAALQQYKVPVESFFYAKGGHGYGLDNPTSTVDWMEACLLWLRTQGFIK